jgi:hypothetical protein
MESMKAISVAPASPAKASLMAAMAGFAPRAMIEVA